jgi:diguanylate cyclase (GGDEF)-like protein
MNGPRGRRLPEHGLFGVERPPRLVLRFAVILTLALALASALILVVVRSFTVSQAEQAATRQASLIAATLLRSEVTSSDFARPVSPARRRELDDIFGSSLVAHETLGVSLLRTDGVVTYSTDHALIGSTGAGGFAAEAASGTIVSRTSTARAAGASEGTKVLETFSPVGRGGSQGGAAAIVQSYEPIERDAQRALLWVGGVLQGLLLVLFAVFVPLLARVTRRIRRQIDEIHFQGFYDELTGLPNRAHLRERLDLALARAAAGEQRVAVLLLNLDHFREINDTLGHRAGDSVLRQVGARLEVLVEGDTLLSRPTGDEFAVVLEYGFEEDVTAVAERIRADVERPILVDGVKLAVEGSVGIARFPVDGHDAETLLRHAEVAVHTAKSWRVGVLTYSPAVDPHDPEQLMLAAELRDAVSRGELVPHFQPKIELAGSVVTGFELLTYWQHPTRGLLPPGAFIPMAEKTGTIRHLSRAVVYMAVCQLKEWERFGADIVVAVNLSAIDLLDLELPEQLEALARENGVNPESICLEITESAIMADLDRARSVLDRLVAIGFRLSMDDFGTGYSSLAYLKNLPMHEVKIDRSLVSEIATSTQDRAIVSATIEMAHNLGLAVVAEGVETAEQQTLLRNLGCDYAQGFLFDRALPAGEAEARLAARTRAAAA